MHVLGMGGGFHRLPRRSSIGAFGKSFRRKAAQRRDHGSADAEGMDKGGGRCIPVSTALRPPILSICDHQTGFAGGQRRSGFATRRRLRAP
jgi:hypothetical protein